MSKLSSIRAPIALYLAGVMWGTYVLDLLLPINAAQFGILPRSLEGILLIPLAPFIHHSWYHLIGNTLPFLVLGCLVQLKGRDQFWFATAIIVVVAGLGTWIVGGSGRHAGASGLVLGYWSYLLAKGFMCRSLKSIVIAVVAGVLYGGFVFVVMDFRAHISWSGHMFGLLGGIVAAKCWTASVARAAIKPF